MTIQGEKKSRSPQKGQGRLVSGSAGLQYGQGYGHDVCKLGRRLAGCGSCCTGNDYRGLKHVVELAALATVLSF
jgi:hypothetical protein